MGYNGRNQRKNIGRGQTVATKWNWSVVIAFGIHLSWQPNRITYFACSFAVCAHFPLAISFFLSLNNIITHAHRITSVRPMHWKCIKASALLMYAHCTHMNSPMVAIFSHMVFFPCIPFFSSFHVIAVATGFLFETILSTEERDGETGKGSLGMLLLILLQFFRHCCCIHFCCVLGVERETEC